MLGVLSSTVGLVLASFAKSAFVYYLTYSLFVGFGICCVRVSNFLIVSKYFCKRKPFATGILTSAAGMGLFVFAPLTESLLDRFGLEKTLRFLAGTVFVTGIPALAYDPNVQENESNNATIQLQQEKFDERTQTKLVDCSVWRVPTFTVFALTFALDRFGQSPTRIHLVSTKQALVTLSAAGHAFLDLRKDFRRVRETFAGGLVLVISTPLADLSCLLALFMASYLPTGEETPRVVPKR